VKSKIIKSLFLLILILLVFCILFFFTGVSPATSLRVAVIGDYGEVSENAEKVAELVKNNKPDIIITVGDNAYFDNTKVDENIDDHIGKYYSEYIYPYSGKYSNSTRENRFFPALGNHDIETRTYSQYLSYFNLPGNGRYYDLVEGDVHFFFLNSNDNEPDGVTEGSRQYEWLKKNLKESSQKWNIVIFHHPPYSSGIVHGSDLTMRWPFEEWGADLVISGHEHDYERLKIGNINYIVDGSGGKSFYSFNNSPLKESLVRYNSDYGALFIEEKGRNLEVKFLSIKGVVGDFFEINNN
jgi:tartrate-resistant acid phosphatase type 5